MSVSLARGRPNSKPKRMATRKWVEAPDALPDSMMEPIFPSSPFAKPTDLTSPRWYLEEGGEETGGEAGGKASEGDGGRRREETRDASGVGRRAEKNGEAAAEEEEMMVVGKVTSGEGVKFPPLKTLVNFRHRG